MATLTDSMATLATLSLVGRSGSSGDPPPENRIAELRQARGWSQEELASRIGCTKSQLSRLENGQRGLSREWQGRLSAALDVAPEDLLNAPPLFSLHAGMRTERSLAEDAGSVDRTLPVCGAGQWGMPDGVGVFISGAEASERVWCPAPLARVRGAYAVRMPDGTMAPKYGANQLLFVHPLRAPQPGAPVVVRGGGRFLVACFVGTATGTLRLERLSPAQRFELDRRGVEAVECVVVSAEP